MQEGNELKVSQYVPTLLQALNTVYPYNNGYTACLNEVVVAIIHIIQRYLIIPPIQGNWTCVGRVGDRLFSSFLSVRLSIRGRNLFRWGFVYLLQYLSYAYLFSSCPSISLVAESCPVCIFHNSCLVHFIYTFHQPVRQGAYTDFLHGQSMFIPALCIGLCLGYAHSFMKNISVSVALYQSSIEGIRPKGLYLPYLPFGRIPSKCTDIILKVMPVLYDVTCKDLRSFKLLFYPEVTCTKFDNLTLWHLHRCQHSDVFLVFDHSLGAGSAANTSRWFDMEFKLVQQKMKLIQPELIKCLP